VLVVREADEVIRKAIEENETTLEEQQVRCLKEKVKNKTKIDPLLLRIFVREADQ
jgi:hypothetical protein